MFGVTSIGAAAKAGDQVLAIAALLTTGVVAGGALFALLSLSGEPALLFGGILGVMVGVVALVAERQLQRLPPGSVVPGGWVFLTFMAWGLAFGWAHDRLRTSHFATTEDTGDTEDVQGRHNRRRFLAALAGASGLISATSTLAGILVGRIGRRRQGRRWSDDHVLPNADAVVLPVPGTRAEFTPVERFYRIDTDTRAPSIDGDRWRLSIGGLVDQPLTLTLAELRAVEPIELFATLCCISNPPGGDLISTTRWTGVSLQRLLPRLSLHPSATHLKIVSADGFFESLALDAVRRDERIMLAYAWDGAPLPLEHGYPLRLYVPDLYGMKQPKWIVGLDAIERWEPGYWVQRGWSKDGRVSTMSAVDVASRSGEGSVDAGGIAFAGARGVSKIEVRLDDQQWRDAEIRQPLSDICWVIWRAMLPAGGAEHVVTVRAFDADGTAQPGPLHSRRTSH